MIAALFVDPDGVYAGRDDVECWGEERDARLYAGPWPVVAHPPCNHWCQLAPVNAARYPTFKIGDDDGCFESALASVRRFGGVLEHPANTIAWARHALPRPLRGHWRRTFDDPGWVTEVSQVAYGCPARKRTWLYLVGAPVELDWSEPAAFGVIGGGIHSGESMGRPKIEKRISSATPPAFRDLLIAMAERSLATV